MELWRNVKGYEGLYQVSNYGRVRSMWYGKVRILKQDKNNKGYRIIKLCKNGKRKKFYVHRLVYEAFNGEIPEGYEINHIDENSLNNRLDNLNLLTHKANINWGTATQRRAEKLSQTVLQLTYPGLEFMCEWPSTMECGRNGFSQGHVSACCLGKQKSHKGVTFRYKETYSV